MRLRDNVMQGPGGSRMSIAFQLIKEGCNAAMQVRHVYLWYHLVLLYLLDCLSLLLAWGWSWRQLELLVD